jgi:hypothetical protein
MKSSARHLLLAVGASIGFAAAPAQAIVLFQDNFDSDSAATVLNFSGLANWTVSNGTIDYIRSGDFGISCVGGAGGCIDLDGSTSNGGRMTSNLSFNLLANETYRLVINVSGNQRSGATDDVTWGFTSSGAATLSGIAPGAAFTAQDFTSVSASARVEQLFIETTSADNVGVIIDNVLFECVTCQNGGGQVPEPGALALLGLGLAGLGVLRKRR